MRVKTMLISLAVVGCVFAFSTLTRREVRKSARNEDASVQRGERVATIGESDSTRELAPRPELVNVARDRAVENAASISAFERRSFAATERAPGKQTAPSRPKPPGRQSGQKRELADPVARVALSLVGADEDAEAYWVQAINDPSLSAHERQDLIEDLNEEGFADPHHPTLEDLPLIVSRLMIIEELEPEAMDEVNSDAFAEAKKDLERMAYLAQE